MKVLFAYRYGILGGVCTQLINRMQYLKTVEGFSAEFVFAEDHGIIPLLLSYGPVYVEPDAKKLESLIVARRYDAVIVIDTKEFLEAACAVRPEVPVICEVHTTTELGLAYLSSRTFDARAYLVPSAYSKQMLMERFNLGGSTGEQVHVVPNIIDAELFHPLALDRAHERPIILWVGKLDAHKNWALFLEIAAVVSVSTLNFELWMVGGETAPDEVAMLVLETVESLNLAHRFRWFPRIPYAAMNRTYAYVAASGGCTLATTENESFGMSVAESLLSGCPVVCPRVGALPELAVNFSGGPGGAEHTVRGWRTRSGQLNRPYLALYDPGDVARACALVESIVVGDVAKRTSRVLVSEFRALKERFSPAIIGAQYLELLRALSAQ